MNKLQNADRPNEYSQVCIWPATILKEEEHDDFKQFMKEKLGTRAEVLESIECISSNDIPPRTDLFFCIHKDDIPNFAIKKFGYGMRYIEDAISETNGGNTLYPERVRDYCTWDT